MPTSAVRCIAAGYATGQPLATLREPLSGRSALPRKIIAMARARELAARPFVAALLGGAVVALFGWMAIAAGWIEAEGEGGDHRRRAALDPGRSTETASRSASTVNQIYERDGRGVAFVAAERPAPPRRSASSARPRAAAPRPARVS